MWRPLSGPDDLLASHIVNNAFRALTKSFKSIQHQHASTLARRPIQGDQQALDKMSLPVPNPYVRSGPLLGPAWKHVETFDALPDASEGQEGEDEYEWDSEEEEVRPDPESRASIRS